MKTKKIIIVMILFALIFAKSEDLSKITNAMTRTEAMAKTKMPSLIKQL